MEWLRQQTHDNLSNVRSFPAAERAMCSTPTRTPACNARTAALDLVHAAANVLRNIEDQSVEAETGAGALADCALEQLKVARSRIQALEMDCDKLNGVIVESNDRLLAAEKALQGAQARILALESQLATSQRRNGAAQNMLMCGRIQSAPSSLSG
jgi:chromosome segregation ATPase